MQPPLPLKSRCLPAISLFSGAGGMDVGFASAGFQVTFANDIDIDACNTYDLNHPQPINRGSLESFLGGFRRTPEMAVIFGGPPCQGFSVAGKMDPSDSRSSLLWRFFDAVEKVRPTAFVCENVKALATLSRWQSLRDQMALRAAGIGYSAAILVLNAASYGVPQRRERMFMIGFRHDILRADPHLLARALRGCLADHTEKPPNVSDIVTSLGRAGSPGNSRICNAIVTYAKAPVLRPSPYAGMLFNGAGRPVPAAGYSSTLPASMGGNKTPIVDEGEIFDHLPSFIEAYHRQLRKGSVPRTGEAPRRLRRMTVDECVRFQTFPPTYQFSGRQNAVYRQIGNAVPCRLAEVVATLTATYLSDPLGSLAQGTANSNRLSNDSNLLFPEFAYA